MKAPDTCTSLQCASYPCAYCARCSHAIFEGSGTDATGKVWRWEFNPVRGPLFLRKDGEPLVRQPIAGRAYDVFQGWLDRELSAERIDA